MKTDDIGHLIWRQPIWRGRLPLPQVPAWSVLPMLGHGPSWSPAARAQRVRERIHQAGLRRHYRDRWSAPCAVEFRLRAAEAAG